MRSATSAVPWISQPSIVRKQAPSTRRPADPPENSSPRMITCSAEKSQMFWLASGRWKCGRAPSAARITMGSAAVPAMSKLNRPVSV